jgi:glycosyltransferase involved in cell wall biosynthesis
VHFTGFVLDNKELAKIYRLANVFVTASEIETQGIVLLEAAASGLPIVAVRATCIPEIVHDNINGRLAAPGDLNELSRSLIQLLDNPLLAENMGKAGRVIAEKYNIKTTLDRHEKLYQVMSRHGKVRRVFPKLLQNVKARGATLLGR